MADNLAEDLLSHYIYQKKRLLEAAGHQGRLDVKRMAELARPRIDKMADVVRDWHVQPDILMEAAFDWAKHNKHPDGPMPNLLFSSKYLMKALSYYLQVPYEVVMEKRCQKLFLDRYDFEYARLRDELNHAGVTDLSTATSYPVEFRYLMAVMRGERTTMFFLAEDLLARMAADRRVSAWLEYRGISYERVAEQFNRYKKSL